VQTGCSITAHFKFERIWLPLIADDYLCRNLRTLWLSLSGNVRW